MEYTISNNIQTLVSLPVNDIDNNTDDDGYMMLGRRVSTSRFCHKQRN
jgi:hypothetical protein